MRIKNILIVLFAFLTLVFLSNEATAQKRKINKKKTKTTMSTKISDDERRKNIENLMLQGKYQHDGSGELLYIGTMQSVPALLKVLEDNPPTIVPVIKVISSEEGVDSIAVQQPAPKKMYICTYAHALTTLRKITGQNFVELQEWKIWWQEYLQNAEKTK